MQLEDLSLALRQGAQGEANLAGLNDQYQRATDLYNTQTARPDKFGRTSGLAVLNDLVGGIRGDSKMRELEPQREAARAAVAENKFALPLYQAKAAQDAKTLAQKNLEEQIGREQTQRDVENERATQNRQDELTKRGAPKSYVNPDGTGLVTVYHTAQGSVDKDGNPVDTSGKVPYIDPRMTAAAKSGASGLTRAQQQSNLNRFRKDLKPIEDVVLGVNTLNDLLLRSEDPNKDIRGIGLAEGGTGMVNNLVRLGSDYFAPPEDGAPTSQQINAAWTGILAPLVRDTAGLTQTRAEIEKAEAAAGTNWATDEDVFRERYPIIMKAIQDDVKALGGTFLPEVTDYYKQSMAESGSPDIFQRAQFENPFMSAEDRAARKQQQTAEENEKLGKLPAPTIPQGVDPQEWAREWNQYTRKQQADYLKAYPEAQ